MFAANRKLLEKKLSDDADIVKTIIKHYVSTGRSIKLTEEQVKNILDKFQYECATTQKQKEKLYSALATAGVQGMHDLESEQIITKLNEAHDRVFIPENFQRSCCCSVM